MAWDDKISSGQNRNPNLTILDVNKNCFPEVLRGGEKEVHGIQALNGAGWLQNITANLISHPTLDGQLRGPRDEDWWYTGIKPSDYFAALVQSSATPAPPSSLTTDKSAEQQIQPTIGGIPHPDLSRTTRQEAIDYFCQSWLLTEVLFGALQGLEAFYRPPYHNQRHPLIFYYVHPAVLYVNKFRIAGLLTEPLDAEIEILFESGVDSMTWDDLSKNDNLWPPFVKCLEYRRTAFQTILKVIQTSPYFDQPSSLMTTTTTTKTTSYISITPESPLWAIYLGIAHEAIHLETSSVLFRELPLSLLLPPAHWPALHPSYHVINPDHPESFPAKRLPEPGKEYPENNLLFFPEQSLTMGRGDSTVRTFGWDNEFGEAEVQVPPFCVSQFPITNGEFYPFVSSGEYVNDAWWSNDGKNWRSSRNIKAPTFWVAIGPQGLQHYALRTIFHIVEMPWNAPVCVNFYEAQAFCQWRAAKSQLPLRLTTEPELTVLRKSFTDAISPATAKTEEAKPQDQSAKDPVLRSFDSSSNLNLRYGAETPVDAFNPSPEGVFDVCGNVWQWCYDYFLPLPGFATHAYYSDFSTPCFDRAHNVIFGGSFISTGNLANIYARYHFRPFFFQHSGFRIAYSSDDQSKHVPTLDHLIHPTSPLPQPGTASSASSRESFSVIPETEFLRNELSECKSKIESFALEQAQMKEQIAHLQATVQSLYALIKPSSS